MDLLLLSALTPDETNAAKAHLDVCERCKDHWRALNDDKEHFEQFVFPRTLSKVEARAARAARPRLGQFRLAWTLPALGLAAAGVLVAITFGPAPLPRDAVGGVKAGGPSLEVFALRHGNAAPFEVTPGANLQPHDRLRFVVNPQGAKYVLIASRLGAGTFSVYHPFGAAQSAKLEPDRGSAQRLELPNAVELDETLGEEELVAVFSDEPVTASAVEAAVSAQQGAVTLPRATVITREFLKVAPALRGE